MEEICFQELATDQLNNLLRINSILFDFCLLSTIPNESIGHFTFFLLNFSYFQPFVNVYSVIW